MCSSRVQEFLDGEKRNNQEKEKKLGVLERDAAKTRLTYQDAETARIAFKDEVQYYTLTHTYICIARTVLYILYYY